MMHELMSVLAAARLVDAANAKRAEAQVQDMCQRTDYEQTMGYACDRLRVAIEQYDKAMADAYARRLESGEA